MIHATPVRQIHQLELTSKCSLRCVYCPSPKMGKEPGYRAKLDMSEDVFTAALGWLDFFCRKGTQAEVNLAGIGESMMRPDFIDLAARVRTVVGKARQLLLATNGLHMTEELGRELAKLNVRVYVSLHRPEKAGLAVDICRRNGILDGVSDDPSVKSNDWAGQVKWIDSGFRPQCPWFAKGWAFVMADGNISPCCLDATGQTVCGDVFTSKPGELQIRTTKLCSTCYQTLDYVPGFDQSKAGEP